jgi:glycosyltransferase involved in cell wall biosynthesis
MNANIGPRLLLLIPNLGRGGAQQVFRDQLNFFSDRYDTIGCVFNWDDSFENDRQTNMISIDVPAGNNLLTKFYFFVKRVYRVRQLKKKYNISIAISHLEGADYVNVFSKRHEKTICWVHGSKHFDGQINGILGKIRKKILIPWAYSYVDKVVTVSNGINKELITKFRIDKNKIRTIYNSFDNDGIEKLVKADELSLELKRFFSDKEVLITHCRLSVPKNLFSLIDIYLELRKRRNVKLMILGDGELRNDLISYSVSKRLKTFSYWDECDFAHDFDVYFMGYQHNPHGYLRFAKVYLMTSAWEGFPLSLCEAMACGVPVVASDCFTGPREIIAPELDAPQPILDTPVFTSLGVLMPLATPSYLHVWVKTLSDLLGDMPTLKRMAASGKNRILDFERKDIVVQWLSVVNGIK